MSRVWVQTVRPNNLHGFSVRQLFLENLSAGFNVVFASNATGKSTLAKSALNLFQPENLDEGATVNGIVVSGEEAQNISTRRKQNAYPGFPGRAKDYYLDLPSLLQGLGKDSGVEQILGSGFQFRPPMRMSRLDNSADVKAAKAAFERLSEARKAKQGLVIQERRLEDLERRFRESENAGENVRFFKGLVKLLELQAKKADLQLQIEDLCGRFPNLDQQRPESEGELKIKIRQLETARRELAKVEDHIGRLEQPNQPLRTFLPSDEDRLDRLTVRYDKSTHLLEALNARVSTAAAKMRDEAQTVFNLSPGEDLDSEREVTAELLQELRSIAGHADRLRKLETESAAFERVLERWQYDPAFSLEGLLQIEARLLEALNYRAEPATANPWLPIAAAATISILACTLPDLLFRLAGVLVACGIGLSLALRSGRSKEVGPPSLTDLPQPFACSNLEEIPAKLGLIAQKRARLEVRSNLDLLASQAADPLDEDYHELLDRAGLVCRDPYLLAEVVDAIHRYKEARRTFQDAGSEHTFHRAELDGICQELAELYAEFAFECRPELERESEVEFRTWIGLHGQRERFRYEVDTALAELGEFLDRQGTPASAQLEDRVDDFTARMGAAENLVGLKSRIRDTEVAIQAIEIDHSRVRAYENIAEEVVDVDYVQALLRDQESLAAEYGHRHQQYQDLRSAIQRAETEHSVESAEAEYRRALVHAQTRWEEACREAIRFRIGEAIRHRLMTEDLPPLLQKANAFLSEFSLDRYRLEFGTEKDEQIGALTVTDRFTGRKQQFKELSTGTKVHTVLSIKLALINVQEESASQGQLKFPLIADEPMAVSDPEASEAIAKALVKVAEERQVILFTNKTSDVALLSRLAPDLAVHGLGQDLPTFDDQSHSIKPRTKLAPAGDRFDPRLPIGAQAVGVFLGAAHPEAALRIDHSSHVRQNFVQNLQTIKAELDREFPRLVWESCRSEKWAGGGYSDRLREALDEFRGDPFRFLSEIQQAPGTSFRRPQKEEAIRWLEENLYLKGRPTSETIARLVASKLGESDRHRFEQITRIFAEAYLPDYDPEKWELPTLPKVVSRRNKAGIPDNGLFEEYLN